MSLNPQLSAAATSAAATAGADAVCALLDGGSILIYSGTRPASPDVAITTQVLLATLEFADPAFAAAVAGVATANAITDDSDADASGEATWFRTVTSADTSVWDGFVGVRDLPTVGDRYDCELSSADIIQHGTVSITSCVFTFPLS